MLTTGIGIGVDLAYWSQAVRFGAALVARQQFLPGTIHDADGVRATWVPLFMGADAERLARLSQRMPASARALSDPDAGHTARPAGGHCPQDLRRRGRGQPGQKWQRGSGGNYTQEPSQKVSFRQRTRCLVEWPEI